jgi:hypothetical protein
MLSDDMLTTTSIVDIEPIEVNETIKSIETSNSESPLPEFPDSSDSSESSLPELPALPVDVNTVVETKTTGIESNNCKEIVKVDDSQNEKKTNPENILLDRLEELYKYVKSILGSDNVTPLNIMMIINSLLQIVEKYQDLTGSQKKMLVLDTIRKVINETVTNENDKIQLLMIVNLTLPHVIDTLVSAINGDLKFEKDKVISWFNKMFCCCKK